jgi:hypothetical protein
MDQRDIDALQQCLRQYRQLSTLHAIRLQAFNFGLGEFELTPAELEPNSPRLVEGSPNDRGKQIAILKQLLELGLSRYVPDPRKAIQKELQRRKALANRHGSPPLDVA